MPNDNRRQTLQDLARCSLALMINFPYANQNVFLDDVDELIAELEHVHGCVCDSLFSAR